MAEPLTKHSKKGVRYTRLSTVESNIDGTEGQDTETLVRRAHEVDSVSAEYITSECLVYLIRAALRASDESRYNALLPILLSRCEANLEHTVRRSLPAAEQIREDILGEFGVLFAEDLSAESTYELDFYECRFDSAFSSLRIDVLDREKAAKRLTVPLADESGDVSDGEALARPDRAKQEENLRRAELLDSLPDDVRKAVVLRDMGYKIESKDKTQTTIASLCGVSGRTIRDRLKQAQEQIQQMTLEET